MYPTSISVWFVCKLCRGSFGQIGAFIVHKKEKHFTQFQNTTSIVFEESEQSTVCPVITNSDDHQFADKSNKPTIKIEVNDKEPINPFSSEIIDEPNFDLVKPKSELITYETEINSENENIFFGLEQPKQIQNPYVRLKRLTSEEIQSACVPQHYYRLLKCEQKDFANNPEHEHPNSSNINSIIIDHNEVENFTEIESTATFRNSREHDHEFECNLCSRKLQSEAHLKIHVGICALYHEDRNRFCVTCNQKFSAKYNFKRHRLILHGTEEEKSSLYKFKCHLCPQRYKHEFGLRFHLRSHQNKKQVRNSKSKLLKCSHPNCGKEFRCNSDLQRHISNVHLGVRPFSCSFPNCNKSFSQRSSMERHFRLHTGERQFKCTVENCSEVFLASDKRSIHIHYRNVHSNSN